MTITFLVSLRVFDRHAEFGDEIAMFVKLFFTKELFILSYEKCQITTWLKLLDKLFNYPNNRIFRFFSSKCSYGIFNLDRCPQYSLDHVLLMRSVILIITLANSHDIECSYVSEQSHKVYLIRIRGRRRRWLQQKCVFSTLCSEYDNE